MLFFLGMLVLNAVLLTWLGVDDPWTIFLVCLATPFVVGALLEV
jgi:hypothetical protein